MFASSLHTFEAVSSSSTLEFFGFVVLDLDKVQLTVKPHGSWTVHAICWLCVGIDHICLQFEMHVTFDPHISGHT